MTLRHGRRHTVRLKVTQAAVRDKANAGGMTRLVNPTLLLFRDAMRLDARTRAGRYSRRIPYKSVTESRLRGDAGLFLHLRSGSALFLEIDDRDDWISV